MSDYFHIAGKIAARLQETVPALQSIRTAAAIEEIADLSPAPPAAIVIWDGDDIIQTPTRRGHEILINQRWLVVLAIRAGREAATGTGVISAVSPLMADVMANLLGWQPEGCRQFHRIESPKPGYSAGLGYFPIGFIAQIVLQSG